MRVFSTFLVSIICLPVGVAANDCSQLAHSFASKLKNDHTYVQEARSLVQCLNNKVIPATQTGGTMNGGGGGVEMPGSMYSKKPCGNVVTPVFMPPALYECTRDGNCSSGLSLNFNDKSYNYIKNSMTKSGLAFQGNEDIILVPKSTFSTLSSVVSKTPVRTLQETKDLLQPSKN